MIAGCLVSFDRSQLKTYGSDVSDVGSIIYGFDLSLFTYHHSEFFLILDFFRSCSCILSVPRVGWVIEGLDFLLPRGLSFSVLYFSLDD